MRSLRELLTTWENWSARDNLNRALERVDSDDAREALHRGLAETADVDPLDALRDAAKLVALLSGWQWQAMYAARTEGSSWTEIAAALRVKEEQARSVFVEALDRQELIRPGTTRCYRIVI